MEGLQPLKRENGRLKHRTAPACTYFVTTNTWQKRELFRVRKDGEIVLESLLKYRATGAYLLHEFVIMPNHLHLLLTPGPECTLEKAMQLIKGGSSHAIRSMRGHKMQIWQPGFLEWTMRDSEDYRAKQQYIWQNPVRRNLTESPEEWIFGSACGKYQLDSAPEKLENPSGAKAPLKAQAVHVRAKAPTP